MPRWVTAAVHRPGNWPLAAGVLGGAGAALVVLGLWFAQRGTYLTGLVVVAAVIGVALAGAVALRRRWLFAASALAVVVAAAVGVGVWLPVVALHRQFTGTNVRWSTAESSAGPIAYRPTVLTVAGDVVVNTRGTTYSILSMADGHRVGAVTLDERQTLAVAGNRLLATATDGVAADPFQLFDLTGKLLWSHPADRALAYAGGVTVLESCPPEETCVETGYADDGRQVWQKLVGGSGYPIGRRFPMAQTLPTGSNIVAAVLPAIALWARDHLGDDAPVHWEFGDPTTGTVLRSVTADKAGVAGTSMVSIDQNSPADSSTVTIAWPGSSSVAIQQVSETTAIPVAVGHLLFLGNTLDYPAIDVGRSADQNFDQSSGAGSERTRYLGADADIDPPDSMRSTPTTPLEVGEFGTASAAGARVSGSSWGPGPYDGGSDGWSFVADSNGTSVSVGGRSAVVTSAIVRTNPFEDSPGYNPRTLRGTSDTRVTVLDLDSGAVTGNMRAHSVLAAVGVRQGSAIIIADGKISLVGKA